MAPDVETLRRIAPCYVYDAGAIGAACPASVVGGAGEHEVATVVGSLCTVLDVLAEDVELPRAEPGDVIEVAKAGSYGYTLSPHGFAGFDPPGQHLLLEDGTLASE